MHGCQCYRCLNQCPACPKVGGLCRECKDHYEAIADAAEGEAKAQKQSDELYHMIRERHLVELLKKAQNRLRNQGDVPFLTLRLNLLVHDEIERTLGGDLLLADSYAPVDAKGEGL